MMITDAEIISGLHMIISGLRDRINKQDDDLYRLSRASGCIPKCDCDTKGPGAACDACEMLYILEDYKEDDGDNDSEWY